MQTFILRLHIIGNIKGRNFIFPSPNNEVTPTGKKKLVKKDQTATDEIVLKPIGEKAMACALRRNIKGQAYRRKNKKRVNKALPSPRHAQRR